MVMVMPSFAQPTDEPRLIQVLQSGVSAADKEDACRRLKQIGTVKSIPALATLLTDEHLYQSACNALETMSAVEAAQALQAALKTSAGKPKVGIIHSLGERRYRPATGELAQLLNDPDSLVAASAARALGRIGGNEASRPLRQSLSTAVEPDRSAIVDALLDCGSQLLVAGNVAEARQIFQQFADAREKEQIRVAAYAGLIRAGEDRALDLTISGIKSTDAARQMAALRLAAEIRDAKATAAFTNLLTTATPSLQIALLRLLQQRGDAAAAPAVCTAARNPDSTERVAAIVALGSLGDATMVSLLANAATSNDEAEQKAARLALTELHRGNVADTMIALLSSASPGVQVELIRALTTRMDKASAPRLLELARTDNDSARRAALRGLEQLADGSNLPALVTLLEQAKDESARAEVLSVFESLADRTSDIRTLNVDALVQGLATTNAPTRVALLQASAFFADAGLRDAFRAGLKDTDNLVRAAAARSLCNSRDAQLMPELLELAKGSSELNLRALALEGYVRLVRESEASFPVGRRVQMLSAAYELASRPQEKKLILSALATAPNLESLQLTTRARSQPDIQTEAEVAGAHIAKALLPSEPIAATTALRQLSEQASRPDLRTNAQSILKQFDSGWLYAGPYRQAGLECPALFDIAFAPEQQTADSVEWRRAAGTGDLARRGEVDLRGVVGGDHCVVYLKTRVFSPIALPVLFEIGSDDGIKLWVNGELVHANNAVRGLVPGNDRVNGSLRQGWNDLLAKITQSTAGCGMILKIANTDGLEISGLRFESAR
jgi:HEAT repeat protein